MEKFTSIQTFWSKTLLINCHKIVPKFPFEKQLWENTLWKGQLGQKWVKYYVTSIKITPTCGAFNFRFHLNDMKALYFDFQKSCYLMLFGKIIIE